MMITLSLASPSTIEAALVGPASFTQVQVAWHHDNPLVTASDPLQRRCRVSPSLAARLVLPRVGSIAIDLPYTAASIKPSSPPLLSAGKTVSAPACLCFATGDHGALQHAVPIQRCHRCPFPRQIQGLCSAGMQAAGATPALILASWPCNINIDKTGSMDASLRLCWHLRPTRPFDGARREKRCLLAT
jgi:hypothetical protein